MLAKKNKAKLPLINIPYQDCPAKTYLNSEGIMMPGRSVFQHCQIVGEVARALIKRLPPKLSTLFPHSAPLIAASHDIGKVSPHFYEKLSRACPSNRLLAIPNINPKLEREWGGHAGVSQVAAEAMNVPKFIPEILGQHHGFSPQVAHYKATDEQFGGTFWQKERESMVGALKKKLCITAWSNIDSYSQSLLMAGLTSVADWIGSGEFFENPEIDWQENVELALDQAGFVNPRFRKDLSFEDVFEFRARATQIGLIEQIKGPGVYVLEAPMGLGKTEAALFAAYQMLEKQYAKGIYFALPTRLTSNKIYERFNLFLEKILDDDSKHSSLLLHGDAWLLDTEWGEEGRPGGSWFNQAKRGLLAPFAVGTIDQALMACMHVKHGFVRTFGLAGKVVILDEIHTYDAYTGTLLDALVKLLRELKCTVIILSATLNKNRREEILDCDLKETGYPLITSRPESQQVSEISISGMVNQKLAVKLLKDDSDAIEEALERASKKQQVLWIENTVSEARRTYLDLAARASEMGIDCGLLHSRFTPEDRQTHENKWVNLFGKEGWKERNQQGRILVGTQVLEQSLDIDADFLVTRFAPTDMLLQRSGRLWRHTETPREKSSTCEMWLLAPATEQAIESPETGFGNSAFVYSPYVLCRSLEVWQSVTQLTLPGDIRTLIEQTYTDRSETGQMARWLEELNNGTRWRTGRTALRQLARITLAQTGKTLPESKAETRYSDSENLDVLLLRMLQLNSDQQTTKITLLSGEQLDLPLSRHALGKRQWRMLSSTLMRQLVAVRPGDAPEKSPLDTLQKFGFHHCFYLGNPQQDEALLRIALVQESGELCGLQGESSRKKIIEYHNHLGYFTNEREKG